MVPFRPRLAFLLRPAGGNAGDAAGIGAAPASRRPHRRRSASWRCAGRWRRRRAAAILDPSPANGDGLSASAAGDPREGRLLLRRLPAHGLGDARARLHAEAARSARLAKRLWSDERRAEVAGALAKLGERYGLIYLGHPGCAGCRVFGPLLRAFAERRYGLDVLAVSLTGRAAGGAGRKPCPTTGGPENSASRERRCPPSSSTTRRRRRVLPVRLRRHGRGPAGNADFCPDRPGARR